MPRNRSRGPCITSGRRGSPVCRYFGRQGKRKGKNTMSRARWRRESRGGGGDVIHGDRSKVLPGSSSGDILSCYWFLSFFPLSLSLFFFLPPFLFTTPNSLSSALIAGPTVVCLEREPRSLVTSDIIREIESDGGFSSWNNSRNIREWGARARFHARLSRRKVSQLNELFFASRWHTQVTIDAMKAIPDREYTTLMRALNLGY